MTQPALTRFTQRKIASAIQAAEGTAETVNGATHGWRLYDGTSGIDVDIVTDNPDSPFYEGEDFAAANERGFVQGDGRLTPPTTPGDPTDGIPELDVALRTAGMARTLNLLARTTVYTPISTGFEIATHEYMQSGLHKQLIDARTSIGQIILEIGQRARATGIRLQGVLEEFDEVDPGAVTVSTGVGPVMQHNNSTQRVVIDGGSPLAVWAKNHGLSLNVSQATKEYSEKQVTDIPRTPDWSIRIAKTDLDDHNPRTIRNAGSIVEITTRLTGSDGRYVELYTRGKLRDFTEVDIDGDMGFDLAGPTRVNSGNDDFSITFGDATFHLNGDLDDGVESVLYAPGTGVGVSGEYTAPVTYSLTAGSLPAGLTLNASTGVPEGTPDAATANDYTFTITATDSTSGTALTASKEFTITITA